MYAGCRGQRKLWKARPRLFRRQVFRPNTFFEAFLKIYRNSITLCLIFSSFQTVSFFRIVWMIFSKIQHRLNVAIFQLTQQLSQILTKCLLVLLFAHKFCDFHDTWEMPHSMFLGVVVLLASGAVVKGRQAAK